MANIGSWIASGGVSVSQAMAGDCEELAGIFAAAPEIAAHFDDIDGRAGEDERHEAAELLRGAGY